MPHLLTDEQKRQRVKVAKKLLQMFPKYDKKQFANVVTGDETWVHYFEPLRKVSNKIWATKHSKRPIIAKRSLSTNLLDEQKRQRVKVAKKLLQMFPKYDKKQFANVVTYDETWVHYFEPVRKVSNKIWATKHSKRPIIAKRSLSTKKVLYAIFFSGEGVAIKVPVKKGKSITGKYYKDVVLKKLKKYYQKRCPATGLVLNMSVFYMTMPQLKPPQ